MNTSVKPDGTLDGDVDHINRYDDSYILNTPRAEQDFKGTIRTFTGRYVRPFSLRVEDVSIIDIAHALSNICRYTGHCPAFYSVAQHSVLVSRMLTGRDQRLAGLLHDAAEVYLNDLASPIKGEVGMEAYREAHKRADAVVFDAFGLSQTLHAVVKPFDDAMFMREAATFWGKTPLPAGQKVVPIDYWREAKAFFLREFRSIVGAEEATRLGVGMGVA